MEPSSRHQCMIYAGAPTNKLPDLATIMRRMMANGYRCLYMNSPAMVEGMRSALVSAGVDVDFETVKTKLVLSSEPVSETGEFDIEEMLQKLEQALDWALKDGFNGLWASGDMTWELGSEKNFEKLLQYEWKLEALFQRRKELHGICQYHRDTLPHEQVRQGLVMHRSVFINETLSRFNPHYINTALHAEKVKDNAWLDKMITELCDSNTEIRRKEG